MIHWMDEHGFSGQLGVKCLTSQEQALAKEE
jgi:hypothetical protein